MRGAPVEAGGRAGDWAEVKVTLLPAGERAPGVPDDTAALPLEARIRGFLEEDAAVGEQAGVTTVTGRRISGTLVRLLPESGHSFGRPAPELLPVGGELRALLRRSVADD